MPMITRSKRARNKRTAAEANSSATERVNAVIGVDTGVSLEPRTDLSVETPLPLARDLSCVAIPSSSGGVVDTPVPQYEFAHRQAALVSNDTEAARIAHQIHARHGRPQSIAGIAGPLSNNNPFYDTQLQSLDIASSSITQDVQDHPKPGFTTHPVISKMPLPYQQKLLTRPAARPPADRPVMKLSVGLLGVYNEINKASNYCFVSFPVVMAVSFPHMRWVATGPCALTRIFLFKTELLQRYPRSQSRTLFFHYR